MEHEHQEYLTKLLHKFFPFLRIIVLARGLEVWTCSVVFCASCREKGKIEKKNNAPIRLCLYIGQNMGQKNKGLNNNS